MFRGGGCVRRLRLEITDAAGRRICAICFRCRRLRRLIRVPRLMMTFFFYTSRALEAIDAGTDALRCIRQMRCRAPFAGGREAG